MMNEANDENVFLEDDNERQARQRRETDDLLKMKADYFIISKEKLVELLSHVPGKTVKRKNIYSKVKDV